MTLSQYSYQEGTEPVNTPEQLKASLNAIDMAKKEFWMSVFTKNGHFYLIVSKEQALEAVNEGMRAGINCFGICMINHKAQPTGWKEESKE